ncbi:MAG: curved DNA-binding protein [Thiomicrorhabdus sp.]|nr:MAG: curved DNA-binding protein [Thiomicrorhabdus sp.]
MNNKYDTSVDYFAVLGIHFGACEKTVKMMYRKMARRYHPDVSTIHEAQKKFQEIAFAYDVLKKHREAYCRDYQRHSARKQHDTRANQSPSSSKARHSFSESSSTRHQSNHSQQSDESFGYSRRAYRKQKPIDGKDRLITYPLTLRYAIRLLKLGTFYIPGLKVKMKFTREAFEDKTFRLERKGYSGLFGGKSGDYLVRFNIKIDSVKYQLDEGNLYGHFSIPKLLLKPNKQIELECPSGRLKLRIPRNYSSEKYIKVLGMGLPADGIHRAGNFYVRLSAS